MKNLKLKAISESELDMISALSSGGIALKGSFEYVGDTFFFLCNRFCWELSTDGADSKKYRIHSSIYFKNTTKVEYNSDFKRHERNELLSLMAIHSNYDGEINLIFANNAIISLTVSKIDVYLMDIHDHWTTTIAPTHNV